jgi:SNARE protein
MSSFDSEIQATLRDIEQQINAMSTAGYTAEQIRDRLTRVDQKFKSVSSSLHHLQTEIRTMDEGREKQQLVKAAADHERKTKELKQRQKEIRDRLASGGAASPTGTGAPMDPRGDGKDAARAKARNVENIQAETLAALKRTNVTVNETQDVADEAQNKLKQQTEQFLRINTKLDDLGSEVERGKKELNAFMRRMMTDKIILCFIVLIIIAIIVVIVLKVKNPFAKNDNNDSATTTTTTTTTTVAVTLAPTSISPPPDTTAAGSGSTSG